ncbi:MAG: serine protease [Burkholderiales bacterium]
MNILTRLGAPLLVCLLAVPLFTVPAWSLDVTDIFVQAKTQIVIVTAYDSKQAKIAQANAIVIAPQEVVTHCHVVKQSQRIDVIHAGNIQQARVRFMDLDRNICQLALEYPLPGTAPAAMMVPSSQVKVGQPVYAVGTPYGQDYTIVRGIVAGVRDKAGDNAKLIQTDVAVASGSSGSGLFDQEGRLVGIVTAGLADAQNLNLVLPTEWITELAKRNLDRIATGASAQPDAAPDASPATPAPPSPAASPLTELKVGSLWKYRMMTGSKSLGTVTFEVTGVSDDKIKERITREGYNNFRAERVVNVTNGPERFQPVIVLPGGYQVPEIAPYFPANAKIRTGAQMEDVNGEYYLPIFGKRSIATQVRVAAQERITVPAGQFESWRIDTLSGPMNYQTGAAYKVKCTYWYAPRAKRTVKMEIEVLSALSTGRSKETYELLSFDLGK